MSDRPVISVVIPCYNAARTIAATIESVLSQQGVEMELLVVDDGSTDDSLAIIRGFEPRLRVLTVENRGASAARNWGIGETSGEWIAFLDSDDLFLPGTLAARLAQSAAADIVTCDWQEFSDAGPVMGPVKSIAVPAAADEAQIAIATHLWAPPAALLYRRSLVEKIGGFRLDLPIIQDARFLFDAAYYGGRFARADHLGAQYRVQPQSLSRRRLDRFWRDVLLNGQQMEALWQARGALTVRQREAVALVYRHAAQGLLATGDDQAFAALAELKRTGRVPLRLALGCGIANVIGPRIAPGILGRLTR